MDFQTQHKSGKKPAIEVCGLTTLNVKLPDLFANLSSDCKPIVIKWKYNSGDKQFIQSEIQKLLMEGIIEPSNSPWRAQVVVTKEENHKKRLVIDYSQTLNKYIQLDAYPLPRIDKFMNNIARYRVRGGYMGQGLFEATLTFYTLETMLSYITPNLYQWEERYICTMLKQYDLNLLLLLSCGRQGSRVYFFP